MSCLHIKTASENETLLEAYTSIVRYSILFKSKLFLKIGKKGKELRALLAVDNSDVDINNSSSSTTSTSAQKKKKAIQASGMERIISSVEKLGVPKCHDCSEILSGNRLHCCLQCVYIGCFKDHFKSHLAGSKHNFDYVYSKVFESILEQERADLNYMVSRIREPYTSIPYYLPIKSSKTDSQRISQNSLTQKCSGILRGLRNMGSTCFMNTILQTMIHNPILKAHFLSENHSAGSCPRDSSVCMACQLDHIFQNFASAETTPFTPHSSLYAMWMSQKNLSGYSQQDAHEYFISLLDEIHKNCTTGDADKYPCDCIIHKSFGGLLQSDIICTTCSSTSHANDPFLDLSLEIKNNVKLPPSKKKKGNPEDISASSMDVQEFTLAECLDEYTVPEKLALNQYSCRACKEAVVKQLSLKVLPPILSFQLKRFEHSISSSQKIESKVKIPEFLDMTPYTTRAIKIRSLLNKGHTLKKSSTKTQFDSVSDGIPSYQYTLFSVVIHEGKLDTGHYKAFCKVRGEWFLFDDQNVTKATSKQVLDSGNVYMCFYRRINLEVVSTD